MTPIASNVAAEKYFDELAFNCYNSPDSLGNPVLLDPKFRQAVAWAVDKQKLIQVAYGGRAVPGSSIVVPGLEYAWQPPAERSVRLRSGQGRARYSPPPATRSRTGCASTGRASRSCCVLGAQRGDREDRSAAKLIASWFDKLGLKINSP